MITYRNPLIRAGQLMNLISIDSITSANPDVFYNLGSLDIINAAFTHSISMPNATYGIDGFKEWSIQANEQRLFQKQAEAAKSISKIYPVTQDDINRKNDRIKSQQDFLENKNYLDRQSESFSVALTLAGGDYAVLKYGPSIFKGLQRFSNVFRSEQSIASAAVDAELLAGMSKLTSKTKRAKSNFYITALPPCHASSLFH